MIKKISALGGKLKASALVVTMIILGIVLVSTLSISLVAVQERKASIGENKSNQAYQTADTGVEKVMQLIKNNEGGSLSSIDADCDGIITSTDGYTVQLKNESENIVTGCSTLISSIRSVKSIGTIGDNKRAVEVAVAVESAPIGTCYDPADMLYIQFVDKGDSCPSGFSGCLRSDLGEASMKGCLPISSQYSPYILRSGVVLSGCLSDDEYAYIEQNSALNWYLGSYSLKCATLASKDKACCHKGPKL